ncbi:MAG: methyltransferase [Propionibacteriaceae bacterium]
MLTTSQSDDLRSAFVERRYTVDEVVASLGEEAHRALGRNSTVAAVRALGDRDDPIATLTALWPLQQTVRREAVERALPGLVEPLLSAGILTLASTTENVNAAIDIRPYASDDGASGWIVSDLSPNLDTLTTPIRPDFVLGVSSASTTLAQLTVRTPVARALDLGTGCGVQTLHLARHTQSVVATDLNPRALELADLTTRLNRVRADLRLGSLYEPVQGERFDLITTNPPYVMAPPRTDADRLTYREGDLQADGLVEQVVRRGAAHLADGGTLQVLGNWAHQVGQDWQDRLRGWIAPTGCDAHVVQRETLDIYEYIEVWLTDAGLAGSPDYARRYAEWVDYFEQLRIGAVGMGWIVLRNAGRTDPWIQIEDWPYAVEQPIGPALAAEMGAVDLSRNLTDAELLAWNWVLADDIVEESFGAPGGADPQRIVHRQQRGFRRAVEVDTALGGILGACDGDLPLGLIIESVAGILGVDAVPLTAEVLPRIRSLVVDGFLS